MNVELTAVWSGDVHGPSRGYLCDAETVFPTRAPPIQMRGENAPRVRKKRSHRELDLGVPQTQRVRKILTLGEHTVAQMESRLRVSVSAINQAIRALRYHGLLRDRELPDLTCGRPRKVYWIQEDGKTADDGRR